MTKRKIFRYHASEFEILLVESDEGFKVEGLAGWLYEEKTPEWYFSSKWRPTVGEALEYAEKNIKERKDEKMEKFAMKDMAGFRQWVKGRFPNIV